MEGTEKIRIGELVQSAAGHDKSKYFIVTALDDEFVYLCDGKSRKADKPKKKKRKHVKKTGLFCGWAAESPEKINNTSVRKAVSGLKVFLADNK